MYELSARGPVNRSSVRAPGGGSVLSIVVNGVEKDDVVALKNELLKSGTKFLEGKGYKAKPEAAPAEEAKPSPSQENAEKKKKK